MNNSDATKGATKMQFHPVAFTSRRPRTNEEERRVHQATDVNAGGFTLCGIEIAHVERVGLATISVPRKWSAMEKCGFCLTTYQPR